MIRYLLIFFSLSLNAQEFENITFLKGSEKDEDNFKVLNAFSNSLMYGFWVNRSLNYNGTSTLLNPKKSEPLTYQGVRTLSLIDLYLTHSALGLTTNETKKIHSIIFSTTMEKEEVSKYRAHMDSYSKTYLPIIHSLVPFTKKINIKSFNENDIILTEKGSKFSKDFNEKVRSKIKEKLELVWERVQSFSETGSLPPEVLNDALMPLNILGEINLNKNGPSYYQFDILLPGLIDYKKINKRGMPTSNPLEWQIIPGFSRNMVPPLQGLAEQIDKMSYMKDVPEGKQWDEIKNKLIHLNIYKDLKETDKMRLTMEFGEISKDTIKENPDLNRLSILPLDITKRDAALKVTGKLSLKKGENINKVLNPFKMEAWIHRLSFDFVRKGRFKTWQERFDANPTFKMVYNEDKSILSMRISKGSNKLIEILSLKSMGFTCVESEYIYKEIKVIPLPGFKYTCLVDLSNSKDFKSIFLPKLGPRVTRNIIGTASNIELKYLLTDLNQLTTIDFSEDTKLFAQIFSLFKDNQILIETLNMLPPELSNFENK